MKRIAVVLGSNIHWAPYYYRYEKILAGCGAEIDLIIWNREGVQEVSSANLIEYKVPDISNNKNPWKVFKFIGFSCFVHKQIKMVQYDRVIFLGTHGCAVSFCAPFLAKYYSKRIWIDVRDDEYEWFPPFYWGEKKSIEASYATAISSYEYTRFLPEHEYLYMHNIDPNADELQAKYAPQEDAEHRIRISFIGNVRYLEQNKKLLNRLGNDDRFVLQYFGSGSEVIRKYCQEAGIKNVDFAGRFAQSETLHFYEKTDIINNAYGNETLNLRTALSNKLYYSLMFKMPILVSENTLMEKLVNEYSMGFTFSDSESFADDLFDWYQRVRNKQLQPDYDLLWDKVRQEDAACVEKLKCFIQDA